MDRRVLVALWRMARPAQIALIVLVYAAGVAMAYGYGDTPVPVGSAAAGRIAFGLAAVVPVAASVHYANEYADIETDAITDRTAFSGGSGALVDTGLPRRIALYATAAAGIIGLILTMIGASAVGDALVTTVDGPPIAPSPAVLLVGMLVVGWQYSLGPFRLAWNGLGEVTNAALGGLALPLYGFAIVTGEVAAAAGLAFVPFTLVVFVNLLETTWPDRRADAAVGKRTLVTRLSGEQLRFLYAAGSVTAVVSTVLLAGRVLPLIVAAATLLPLVGLLPGYARFTQAEAPLPAVATMVVLAASTTFGWVLANGGASAVFRVT